MACNKLSSGRCRNTCGNIGGIKGVWMANVEDVDWLQTLNLVFSKNETALRDTVNELAQSEVVAIAENADGTMWFLGEEGNGLLTTTATSNSGTAAADLNGWTLALTSTCTEPAIEVLPGEQSALKTALATAKNC